jgi:hypothetical protein
MLWDLGMYCVVVFSVYNVVQTDLSGSRFCDEMWQVTDENVLRTILLF